MSIFLEGKYFDAASILLVNRTGVIRRLYCPFQVKLLAILNGIEKGVCPMGRTSGCKSKGRIDVLDFWKVQPLLTV